MSLPPEIESEITESFVRASGPGGQHVNKVSTGVRLEFDVYRSTAISNEVGERLLRIAGRRASRDGIISIVVTANRSQKKNRLEARDRLEEMLEEAKRKPKLRRKTRPTRASKERRLKSKKLTSKRKQDRKKPPID